VLNIGQTAPPIPGFDLGSGPALIVFFETDCPTWRLAVPYLNKLALSRSRVGVSERSGMVEQQHSILCKALRLRHAPWK
jgi:hypothetical protein